MKSTELLTRWRRIGLCSLLLAGSVTAVSASAIDARADTGQESTTGQDDPIAIASDHCQRSVDPAPTGAYGCFIDNGDDLLACDTHAGGSGWAHVVLYHVTWYERWQVVAAEDDDAADGTDIPEDCDRQGGFNIPDDWTLVLKVCIETETGIGQCKYERWDENE